MGSSEADRDAGPLGSDPKSPSACTAIMFGIGVCGTAEEVRNLIVNRKKSLGLPG
jgi:hypothetical protein